MDDVAPDLEDAFQLLNMIILFTSEEMEAYKISTFVNSPKNNSAVYVQPLNL